MVPAASVPAASVPRCLGASVPAASELAELLLSAVLVGSNLCWSCTRPCLLSATLLCLSDSACLLIAVMPEEDRLMGFFLHHLNRNISFHFISEIFHYK